MDNSTSDKNDTDFDSDVIKAEIVEMAPGAPWEWREIRPVAPPPRRWRLTAMLFVATCLSTLLAGVYFVGDGTFLNGLRYSIPVMTILLCHEMGHYLQARRYGVHTSLPYFIPMPFSPLGTFGAVIAMEPRMGHRRALFDIGISGPLAGLVPTMIFLVVGLHQSSYGRPSPDAMLFGDPLLFRFLANWILGPMPQGYEVVTDPMAFAGWVGLLVTSLNLIPIGQLDGGHVLYALLREKANKIATLLLLAAVFLVAFNWRELMGWMLMLFLLMMMGPRHPPTADDSEPLGTGRTVLGWLTLAFIIIGFTPTPFRFVP